MKQKCYHKIKDINIHIREIEFLGVLNEKPLEKLCIQYGV